MPDDRSSDLPGSPDDPTRINDPVDPTRVQEPVDPTRVQGAAPAAGVGRPVPPGTPPRDGDPVAREAARPDGDRNSATWLWALLAAVLIGIVLFALLQSGDDDDAVGTVDETTDTLAPETSVEDTAVEDTAAETTAPPETAAPAAPEDSAETTTTAATDDGGDAGEPGTVTTSDGTDLLGLVEGGEGDAERLAPYAGEDVTGTEVEVLEVADGQGLWIGMGDQQRLFLQTTENLGVGVGETVTFDGTLVENDGTIGLSDDEDAELLEQQGHHIELGELAPA